jgi:lipoate synthase
VCIRITVYKRLKRRLTAKALKNVYFQNKYIVLAGFEPRRTHRGELHKYWKNIFLDLGENNWNKFCLEALCPHFGEVWEEIVKHFRVLSKLC